MFNTKMQSLYTHEPSANVHSHGQALLPYASQQLQETVTSMQYLAVAPEHQLTCWSCVLHVHQAAVSASELLK